MKMLSAAKMKFRKLFVIFTFIFSSQFISSETFPSSESPNSDLPVCSSPICRQTATNLLNSMDQSIDPCKDFYSYSCGNFIKKNPVPANKIEYGKFTIVAEDVRYKIQEILTSDRNDSKISPALKAAISTYNMCLEVSESSSLVLEILVDKFGGSPIIDGDLWDPDAYNVLGAILQNLIYGNSPFFSVDVGVDEKNSSVNIIYIDQAEMNVDNDYYLDPEGYEHVLEAYKEFIVNISRVLVGNVSTNLEDMALNIIQLETSLANISSTFIDRQNSTRMYNRMTIGQLQNLTDPDKNIIDWVEFLQSLLRDGDINEDEPIIVNEISYMNQLFSILNATDTNTLADYLVWNFIMFVADDAWGQIEQLNFQFQEVTGGAKNRTARWEKCADNIAEAYSYAVGQNYVDEYTNANIKSDAFNLLTLLQQSFISRLLRNGFMDNATKAVAIDKVNSMLTLVGYPDWINNNEKQRDYYKNYPNVSESYLLNVLSVAMAVVNSTYSQLRLPTDPKVFSVSPMDVNAFYTPTYNSITVPVGILNPPFYQSGAPSATNFGGLGSVLGHEITHGFDNDGRKFDQEGNLKPWWPQAVVDAFEIESQCFEKQYSRCCPLRYVDDSGVKCVNGRQTLGENMADNGGLEAAFQAWREFTKENGDDTSLPGMEDFTPEQIFYLSFANVWCESTTIGSLLAELSSDEHAPESCRVNGVVANSENFALAFNCSKGPMNRQNKRCSVW